MAEETFFLVLLTIVMLIGSFLAGSIPLVMKLSEEKLKLITVFGAGLLVGTALAVIIPEGIRSIYLDTSNIAAAAVNINSGETISISNKNGIKENFNSIQIDHSKIIGFSLVLGFVFMMIVDQISQSRKSNEKNITATLGLVVHAAADGVALGAAATTSHQDVEVIVFLAIMLHKAPAAFGLVSFLLHEKMERQEIRKHLAFFCLSAPAFSLLTYFGIGKEQKDTLNSMNATGIAMLFSAGTFLYVATVHVLPELTQMSQDHSHTVSSQYDYKMLEDAEELISDSLQKQKPFTSNGLKLSELLIMSIGAFLPLIITFSHHH